MSTYNLIAEASLKMAISLASYQDFELWYSPSKEDYELALDLNAGKRITDMRTRGAKMLKKLKDRAREDYLATKNK